MSEAKRVSLQSAGPVKKDKKAISPSTTIRLDLTLPRSDQDSYGDFNYKALILNEKKKEKNKDRDDGQVNGFGPLDPYASDDEDNLKEIARNFESKYGTPKKKYRRLEDYTELGTGYDENDSFIDNTDAFDEVLPEDQTTERGGFYVNKGQLLFKRVAGQSSSEQSDSDSSEGSPNTKSLKRTLESESESGSSDSSEDSSESDDSEDSEADDENEAAEIDTEESPLKENKTNGHVIVPPKKPKLSDEEKCPEFSTKKVKNKAITGLFLKKAVREKDHNENREKFDTQGQAKRISNIDAAIEAVARGEDSKESGIAESKSHSDLSDSYESDESQDSLKVNGRENGLQHPLPDNLPEKLLSIVSALKSKAAESSSESKRGIFSEEVNSLLLRFEKNVRLVPCSDRGLVYDHLECYLPGSKEYLTKKGSAMLRASVEAAVQEPLLRLKAGIDKVMPNAMARYKAVCAQVQNERSVVDLHKDTQENPKSSSEKAKIPRRRFPWSEDLKSLLCLVVKKRRVYFHTTKKNKEEGWESHLRVFLKKDVLPMWEVGWMTPNRLMEIITKMQPELLQATPSNHVIKMKKLTNQSPPAGGNKSGNGSKPMSTESVAGPPPALSPAPVPQSVMSNPTPPPPALLAISPIPSPASPSDPHQRSGETESPVLSTRSNPLSVQFEDGLLDLSSVDAIGKKNYPPDGSTQISSGAASTPNNSSCSNVRNMLDGFSVLSSLASNVSLSVKPVQSSSSLIPSNAIDTANHEMASKKHDTHGNTALSCKSSHINSSRESDALNLVNQYSVNDAASSLQNSSKKRLAVHHSSLSVKAIQSSVAKPPFSSPPLEMQKSQPSSIVFSSNSPQPFSSPTSSIKVSSVAAINKKLNSQAQALPCSTSSHPLKTVNLPNISTVPSSKPSVSTFSTSSVISHSMESSLSITPVKPLQLGKVSIQPSSASSVQSNGASVTSTASFSSRSERSEVIVTPSSCSNMPHIKITPVSSNLQSHRPDSAISYSTSNLNAANVTVRKPTPSLNINEAQGLSNTRPEKNAYAASRVGQDRESPKYVPPTLFSSPVTPNQLNSPPSKAPMTSEKILMSRKTRILQESRDRGVIDCPMPTLSGPYRNNPQDTSSNIRHYSKARAPPSRNHLWDEDFFMVEELLSTSPSPVHSPKVSAVSMDSCKQLIQVPESQRSDTLKNDPPLLEPQKAKSVATSSESQRVIVRQAPTYPKESLNPCLQSRDHLKTTSSQARTSIPSSSVIDTTRANVVMTTSSLQDSKRVISIKDEMSDILASIPSQMISRTDHYTITNSMQTHHKRSGMPPNVSDVDVASSELKDEPLQTPQELALRGALTTRSNCDVKFQEDSWGPGVKKTPTLKPSSDLSDHRLSGISGLSMSGLDGMGGMSLGLPPHLVGYQNDYQRHLYGSASKSGQNDQHHPT